MAMDLSLADLAGQTDDLAQLACRIAEAGARIDLLYLTPKGQVVPGVGRPG